MADDKLKNFIPVSRKIFSHELWEEKREFSKFEAWLDLLQSARFDKEIKTEWINNKEVKFGRGQLIGSIRFLRKRWNWGSNSKVERYLSVLKNKDMIDLKTGQGINIITICKYEDYNKELKSTETPTRQQPRRQQDKTNKDNIDNKENSNNLFSEPSSDTPKLVPVFSEKKELPLYSRMVEIWIKETHPDFVFSNVDGVKIKSLIVKIKKILEINKHDISDQSVSEFFSVICSNLPEYFKDKDLKIIDSDFNQIVTKIKDLNNGTKQINKYYQQSNYDAVKSAFGS